MTDGVFNALHSFLDQADKCALTEPGKTEDVFIRVERRIAEPSEEMLDEFWRLGFAAALDDFQLLSGWKIRHIGFTVIHGDDLLDHHLGAIWTGYFDR